MNTEAYSNREKLEKIKMRLDLGQITYQQAREEAQPLIDWVNHQAEEIAKKYGKKAIKLDFTYLMR